VTAHRVTFLERVRKCFKNGATHNSDAARIFVKEGPVTDVVRTLSLAILHKNYFDATAQFLIDYHRI